MKTLREKGKKRNISKSETPIVIYITVVVAALGALGLGYFNKDLSLNILAEVVGAAFTLFVIDVILVKSKTKRWHIVQDHVDYLIGRTVNRIRDGVATKVFLFQPQIDKHLNEHEVMITIRKQREIFLKEQFKLSVDNLAHKIDTSFFSDESYDYFHEKADDIWDLINMKYAEFLAPPLVVLLIDLHTNLVDVCAFIRVYEKAKLFPEQKEYYHHAGKNGVAKNMKKILRLVIKLKEEGYSDAARHNDHTKHK